MTVIGPPLELPCIAKPTPEEVAKYHELYKQALIDLFNRYATISPWPSTHVPYNNTRMK